MRHLQTMTGRDLCWVRPAPFKREYELRAGDICVAELGFERPFGWTALARTGEGSWVLDQRGVVKSQVTVRSKGTSMEIARLTEKRGARQQQILLSTGSSYTIGSDFLRTRFTLEAAADDPLVVIRRRGFFRVLWDVEIRYRAKSNPDLPWLVMLLWFYILLQRSRSRSH